VYLFREFVSISEPATAVSSNNNAVKEKEGVGKTSSSMLATKTKK
jgi:hypothetical protein